jgi:hypothetical protein
MTIRTNPPGALVYVDDYEIGVTPVSTDFVYYGPRKMRLVKAGYQTQTFLQPVPAPWYQYTPLDFVTENLIPGEIRDQRVFNYQLTPQLIVPPDRLVGRAEGLRRQVQTAPGNTQLPRRTGPRPEEIPTPAQTPLTLPPPPANSAGGVPPFQGPQTPVPQGSPPVGGVPMHTLPPGGY